MGVTTQYTPQEHIVTLMFVFTWVTNLRITMTSFVITKNFLNDIGYNIKIHILLRAMWINVKFLRLDDGVDSKFSSITIFGHTYNIRSRAHLFHTHISWAHPLLITFMRRGESV
ncbi:hypothetical protein BDA99DRAFT_540841 [Phascolomyces articulosus]|uniref:Uncharacterized protein n=1 Tax=Phascolomyces articulosus TaxID=60185 RepID=A0AAD5JST4_9FUNG|nr:hypothetical protein BDA99DRAFT_540841 [Phascolomyces articulosus]